jgi:DNA (cytosine-5)-methyltransferase 1
MGKVHASLFSGFGAADLAAEWMGWDNAFWCEIDNFPRTVLSYWFPKSKGYGNIKETDFTPWRGKIDVLTGGFPCQPFSVAGQRKGQEDDRYLWPEMLRAIREIRPTWVIGENVSGIISMVQPGCETEVEHQAALFEETDKETLLEQEYVVETICRDLEQEGYSIQPIVIPACAVEAPHRRDRIFFIAYCADAGTESLQRKGEDGVY